MGNCPIYLGKAPESLPETKSTVRASFLSSARSRTSIALLAIPMIFSAVSGVAWPQVVLLTVPATPLRCTRSRAWCR